MLTVVYYTSNTEDEEFEQKIRDHLVATVGGRHPIISVSQKPIDLGENICVGEVGQCDANAFRQLQIGIEHAKTEFIASAESDTLYPPGYFDIIPPDGGCWRYPNVYILKKWIGTSKDWGGQGYRRKRYSECAQMASRRYWLRRLGLALKGRPTWGNDNGPEVPLVFSRHRFKYLDEELSKLPVLNIKTDRGLRKHTRTLKTEDPQDTIPYWGFCNDMRDKLFGVSKW